MPPKKKKAKKTAEGEDEEPIEKFKGAYKKVIREHDL